MVFAEEFRQLRAPERLRNVFVHGRNFYMAWLDGQTEKVSIGRWHEVAMTIHVAGAGRGARDGERGSELRWLTDEIAPVETGLRDGSFEKSVGFLYAVVRRKWIPIGSPVLPAWRIPRQGVITTETARTGRCSAKVVNPTGDYALFTQTVNIPPGSKVRLSAWVKGEGIKRGDAEWRVGMVGISVLRGGQWQHHSIQHLLGTFDWRKVEGVFEIPKDATAVMIRAGLNGATGTMWIDDIELEVVR